MSSVAVARMELLDELMIEAIRRASGKVLHPKPLLMIEFVGESEEEVAEQVKKVEKFAKQCGGGELNVGFDEQRRDELWQVRKDAFWSANALKPDSKIWTTDVCVPVSRLSEMIRETKEDLAGTPLVAPIVAHAGDGNFHMFLLVNPENKEEFEVAQKFNKRLVLRAISKDGTCTGEHGVGSGKLPYLETEHGAAAVELMKTLKKALDPNNIMNPGKIINMDGVKLPEAADEAPLFREHAC